MTSIKRNKPIAHAVEKIEPFQERKCAHKDISTLYLHFGKFFDAFK